MKATKAEIIKAIDDLFGDTSVSKRDTMDAMEEIQSEIEMKIEALAGDIANEDE